MWHCEILTALAASVAAASAHQLLPEHTAVTQHEEEATVSTLGAQRGGRARAQRNSLVHVSYPGMYMCSVMAASLYGFSTACTPSESLMKVHPPIEYTFLCVMVRSEAGM